MKSKHAQQQVVGVRRCEATIAHGNKTPVILADMTPHHFCMTLSHTTCLYHVSLVSLIYASVYLYITLILLVQYDYLNSLCQPSWVSDQQHKKKITTIKNSTGIILSACPGMTSLQSNGY